MTRSISIIGGGAIGLSLAWELSRRGCQVALIERNLVGQATSHAATGILPPARFAGVTDPLDQLRGLSHELFPDWADTLRQQTGIDIGYRQCGGWYLADSPGEQAAMMGMTGYWTDLGIQCEPVPLAELAKREPALTSWTATTRAATAAWWTPGECQLRPPAYLQALAEACRHHGVRFIENSPVSEIRDDGQSAAARIGDRWHDADQLVVCGGPWTGKVSASMRLDHAIVPIRGQILLLKTATPLLRSVVNLGHRYLVCRDDGHTLIGSCEEEAGFELGTDESTLGSLWEFASTLIPELRSARRVHAWSALRPMTFDGFPMIGRVPGSSNLYVAAGHFRSGIHLSPGTAVVLADTLLGIQPPISLDAFRIGKQQQTADPVQPQ